MDSSLFIAVGAIAALGLVFGIILAVASKLFAVKSDPLVEEVRAALPGANCGACGYAGCDQYAEAVAAVTTGHRIFFGLQAILMAISAGTAGACSGNHEKIREGKTVASLERIQIPD